ncbi:Vacuolar protein sorting-associated protein 29 [Mycena venus]|uniref:Vacuolar protein sorting-associated protein 29 n=1 Tax=Mycena venus TaxID=2733690 RepID=A0A8H6YN19_9AGAR|nr:Vacuolar protein sorting-associated protein 29 [Mycena venus]
MVLVLIIGDLHIPHRTHDLPSKFKKLLVPGKIQQILCTGNVCDKETYEYLRTISPDVNVVKGDYDETSSFPSSITVVHSPIKIGVIHGHQSVPCARTRQQILREPRLGNWRVDGCFQWVLFLSQHPPSAKRVFLSDPTPSFALMDIQGPVVVTYVYQLIEGEVRVEKIEWRKEDDVPPPRGAAPPIGSPPPGSPQPAGVW